MRIQIIEFSRFKASGTAMFGSTPHTEWQRLYPPDSNGLCDWALRSLLINDGTNLVLIDSGFGNTDETVLLEYCVRNYAEPQEIISSQQLLSISHVLHTHLHLDHCGGSFSANIHCEPEKTFATAQYILGSEQLQAALYPEAFEQSSFQPEIIKAISLTSNLKSISSECFIFPWLEVQLYNGHTRGMLIPVIHTPQQSIAFVGDLIPSAAHLTLQSTMQYDMNQVLALAEREEFLEEAYENEYILLFQHDAFYECCSLKKENGRVVPHRFFKLNELEY